MATTTLNADLPADIFDVQTNIPLIHQVVVAQLAAARQGTHSVKTRGEVRGGGRKPYRQKGTGRARQGSIRAPQFTGGGIVHGPVPRDYVQRTPKKMKAAALRGALSDRARGGRIHVIDSLADGDIPSTSTAKAVLTSVASGRSVLVVLDRSDVVSLKSVRNLADVHVLAVDQLNTYDVLCADDIVFTQAAIDTFVGAPVATTPGDKIEAKPAAKKATAKKAEPKKAPAKKADSEKAEPKPDEPKPDESKPDEAAEVRDFGPDSALATDDGLAPEGFDIKGNADSMKYHVPGSRWYDATAPEVWFKTVEAAAAAGFAPAGGAKAQQVDDDSAEEKK